MKTMKTNIGKKISAIVIVIFLLIGSVGYAAWYNLLREIPTYYESAEEHFKYGSIGTENAEGLPYWIWVVLPRLFPEKLPSPGTGGYTSFGLTWEPGKETPVGITKKTIGFERQGLNCAICHTATYRKNVKDNPVIVTGGPVVKFDSQRYLRFLFDCVNDPRFTADYILPEIAYNHKFSWLETQLYRWVIIPETKKALLKQQKSYAWINSRPDWGSGRIDPFNPPKFRFFGIPDDKTIGNSDMMPLWNEKQHEGFAYHWDGLETDLMETMIEGALGGGATQKSVDLAGIKRIEGFIKELQPPKYPFNIDPALVEKGIPLFAKNCASCHIFGGERTGKVISLAEVGTDRHRLDMWTQAAVNAYQAYTDGYPYDLTALRKTDGYVSVALDGLWLRSPYLHNGSVPSLTDLLEKPENRTKVFYRGYDVYNPEKVGFVTSGGEAEKVGFRYDTSIRGNSNQGHLYGTDLPAEDKKALIEYLKTL